MKWTVLISLLVAAGCAVEPELTYEQAAPRPPRGGDEGCVGVNCTGNSPLYAALGIFELSANPEEVSARGFSIDQNNVYLEPGAHKLANFHVEGLTLMARDTTTGNQLPPVAFTDVRVRIKHKSGTEYDLQISQPRPTTFYAPALGPTFFAYQIRYRPVPPEVAPRGSVEPWTDLCPYVDPFEDGTQGTWAVFWRGDRIHPDTGVFYAHGEAVGNWFNISCAGEAPGKVVRTGATYAVNPATTQTQAQASLDMFTAHYCPNTTTRYTRLGTDIDWDDKTGSNTLPTPPTTFEAIWNGNGAYCIRTPRLPRSEFGGYACSLKSCSDDDLTNWRLHGEVRSGT